MPSISKTSFAAYSARCRVVHLVEVVFESVEAAVPERAIRRQPVVDLAKRVRSQAIQASLCVHPRLHQARLAQHAQVLRDSGLAHGQPGHEVADRELAQAEKIQDSTPV